MCPHEPSLVDSQKELELVEKRNPKTAAGLGTAYYVTCLTFPLNNWTSDDAIEQGCP